MDLLAIVQAEQEAEALLRDAQAKKELAIKAALAERDQKLANLHPPRFPEPKILGPRIDIESLRKSANRNKQRAVNAILEELHATP